MGLLLAIVDFAGWAPALERGVNTLRAHLSRFMDSLVPRRPEDPDQLQGFDKKTDRVITYGFIAAVIVIALAFLYFAEKLVEHPSYPTNTIGDIVLLIVGAILGFGFACVVAILFLFLSFNFLVWGIIAPSALTLHILSIPRRGILTTVGLLAAIAGVLERYF
jgi:hypothetical protein